MSDAAFSQSHPPILDVSTASILAVDDNEQNLELLIAYLEGLHCEVRTAPDGVAALEAVALKTPDLILMDVMMPRMSGFQACAKIRADPATRDTPILMVTALSEVSDVERAVESGANDFLTKPVNKLELLTRVRSLLQLSMVRKQLNQTMAEVRRLTHKAGEGEKPTR